jgi:choline dehydrogenase-like flavoprotein
MSFDVIVVGAGAGGLAAAYKLTIAGKRVLLIEKGHTVRVGDAALASSPRSYRFVHQPKEFWQDANGKLFLPDEFSNVGGKTKWYGGALLRLTPQEFRAEPPYRALGWPISYGEFLRYYQEAEMLFSPRYFDHEDHLKTIIADMCDDGRWTCEPIPMALKDEILHDQRQIKYFDGCANEYKRDSENVFGARIGTAANFRIVTGTEVVALLHADRAPSHITGVGCSDGSMWRARAVIAAAGAMRSPLLLQRHVSRTGLAGSPLIGALFKKHLISTVCLISLKENRDVMRKTAAFLSSRYPHTTVQCLAWFDPESLTRKVPNMVPPVVVASIAARCTLFFIMTEDGSHPSNTVRWLDGGPPILDYDAKRLPEAEREHRQARRDFCWRLKRSGRLVLARSAGVSGTAHAVGTLVAGNDPATSIVNGAGKAHRMQGLYVADGSALPRSGRVNPALTIYAWGLRVGELLTASFDSDPDSI